MLTAAGSALVVGAAPDKTMADKIVSAKVLRPFLLKTERQEAGKVIQIDSRLAAELAGQNKVQLVAEAKPQKEKQP